MLNENDIELIEQELFNALKKNKGYKTKLC